MKGLILETSIVAIFVTWCLCTTTTDEYSASTPYTGPQTNTTINITVSEIITIPSVCPNYPPHDFDICPEGYNYIATSEDLCYTIKKNQTFPPKCDYPTEVPLNNIKEYLSQIPSKDGFWLNVYRNKKDGFGHLEWSERGNAYGTIIPYDRLINPNVSHDCVIYRNQLLRVSCSDSYDTVCVYSMQYIQTPDLSNMCNSSGDYFECNIGHYNLQKPTCFCKKLDVYQPFKKNFCEKIAEPIFPYQSKLLQEYFSNFPNSCWIGFYNNQTNFKWCSTNENVTYTWWALPEKCNKEEGAFKFSSNPYSGWFLAEDRTLNCAICEFDLILKDSSLKLEYIDGTSKILLTVDNELSISKSFGVDLHCFTDTNEDDFKEKLKIDFNTAQQIGSQMKITMDVLKNRPGYYWCVGFQYNTNKPVVSNSIVAYDKTKGYGNEYVVFVAAVRCKDLDPFINRCYRDIHETIESRIKGKFNFVDSVRLMRGYYVEYNSTILLTIHITTNNSRSPINSEYDVLNKELMKVTQIYPYIKIRNFLSSEFCLADDTCTSDNQILQWPMTRIGAVAIPENILCLDDKNGRLPVTRKCAGNFLNGGKWEKVNGDCLNTTIYSETTTELFDLWKDNATSETYIKLKNITNDNKNKEEIDVYLISSVMKKLVNEKPTEINSSTITDIVSNLMNFDQTILTNSQKLLNATDEVLSALDHFIDEVPVSSIVSDKLIVQISEYLDDQVIGGVLYGPKQDSNRYTFVPLYNDTNLTAILNDSHVEMIILTPMKHISQKLQKLSIKIFYNDILFNEVSDNKTYEPNNKIVSVSVNGQPGALTVPITIVFKVSKKYKIKNCSYWQYGLNSELESIHGKWIADNSSYNESKFEICNFYHMTHFGLLFQGPEMIGKRNVPLEILIAIGSILSLIGVIPIFLSAISFKTWRMRTGNIILVNFCLAISLQSILTLLLYTVRENGKLCTVLGVLLHYCDVSEFCWMLVVAYLQYRRFVMVFNHKQKRLLGKCLIIGWVLPFVPVLVILIVAPDKYRLNSYGYCYVVEEYFLYGSLIPILVILGINTIIFTAIMWSIWKQKSEEYKQNKTYKLEILLAVFLFFTLGLTWFFGIAGALGGGLWFTYLFCAMTSIRGLILFLFFVLGNKELKMLWQKRYHYYVKNNLQESSTNKPSNSATISNE